MAAIQVKHAENKQLQNKNPTAENKTEKVTGIQERKVLQGSAKSSLRGIIFNIYGTIIEDDSGFARWFLAINQKKQKKKNKLLLHIQVSSRSHCGIDFLTTVDPLEIQLLSKLCACVSVRLCALGLKR